MKELQPNGLWDKTKQLRPLKQPKKPKKKATKAKRCKYCKSEENLTIDHKIPKSKGGTNEKSNLQTLCMTCNGTKSDMTDKQIRNFFKWFLSVQQSRINHGKKPYTLQ
jgi:5-methylcytosine-specific restriction endonuclease McrA